jgi:hypothetical protein
MLTLHQKETRTSVLHEILKTYYGPRVGVPAQFHVLATTLSNDWLDHVIATSQDGSYDDVQKKALWATASPDSIDWLEKMIARKEQSKQEQKKNYTEQYNVRDKEILLRLNPRAASFIPRLYGG